VSGRKAGRLTLWFVLLPFFAGVLSLRANVYATDIQLNNSLYAGAIIPGSFVRISYILNEPATAGVAVNIYSGASLIWNFTAPGGGAGASAGSNSVVWTGTNLFGSNVAAGIYSVAITAAADGYSTWTNITDDSANFSVFEPSGVVVNKNIHSPYYGRVFIGNDVASGGVPVGLLKYNADGSAADEGGFSTGGYPWSGGTYMNPSPWKMGISDDDRLYVEDWSGNGTVMSFDQVISSNYLNVLRMDNYSSFGDAFLSGPFVRGAGTNTEIWMADAFASETEGAGIVRWFLSADGTLAPNDQGEVIVTLTNNSDLDYAPFAVSVGSNNYIYTSQLVVNPHLSRSNTPATSTPLLCFPPFSESSGAETVSFWKLGNNDPNLVNPYGVSVDPTATFVAAAIRGQGADDEDAVHGGVSVFRAADGSLITNITQDPNGNIGQVYIDVAWDNVSNLYALDYAEHVWRVYSPPGANQATTAAAPIIQVLTNYIVPRLSNPTDSMGQLEFTLTGQINVTYAIQESGDLAAWTTVTNNFSADPIRAVSLPADSEAAFFRAVIVVP